jgi:hypothetical protein
MSTETVHIEIDGVRYALRFGYAALRQLGKLWGLNDLQEIFLRLGKLGDASDGTLSIPMLDIFGDMILAAIIANKENDATVLDTEMVVEALMVDHSIMQEVMQSYIAALPQPEKKKAAPAKRIPEKKVRKKS